MNLRIPLRRLAGVAMMVCLSACGGGSDWVSSEPLPPTSAVSTPTFSIGGTVSGLAAGSQVVLNNIGGDPVTINGDGSFTFATPVVYSGGYVVTVGTQPVGQTCTVSNGMGAGAVADVSNIRVVCSATTFAVAGAVFGLTPGQQVTVSNNGADATTVGADGNFSFATPVALNGGYAVTVQSQPVGQTCTVTKGAGAGVVSNISNVGIVCSINTFTVSGTIDGLAAGSIVTINNNSADALILLANGQFSFATPVAFKGAYTVAVGTQPVGKTCSVSNATGVDVTANVANVNITCSINTYTISGTVSGLLPGTQVTLSNNGADPVTVSADGAFTFAMPVAYNGGYDVAVATYPMKEGCHLSATKGSGVAANVSDVKVNCLRRSLYAYVASTDTDRIYQYTIGEDGGLSPMGTPKVVSGSGPNLMTVDPTNRYLFVANSSGTVSTFTIGGDGSLTMSSAVAVTGQPYSIALDPTGRYAYVGTLGAPSIAQFSIGINGRLTPIAPPVQTRQNVYSIAADPFGNYIYATDYFSDALARYAIGSDGALAHVGNDLPFDSPQVVALDPTGRFAYAQNFHGPIGAYAVGPGGTLISIASPTDGDYESYWMAIDPLGRFVYNIDYYNAAVFGYSIDSDGALISLGGSVTADFPQGVFVEESGSFAYVPTYGAEISQFRVGDDGRLSKLTPSKISTGDNPVSMAFSKGQ